jgi:hypothetical protein
VMQITNEWIFGESSNSAINAIAYKRWENGSLYKSIWAQDFSCAHLAINPSTTSFINRYGL